MTINESPIQKIKADLQHYARRENRRVSLSFTLRMFFLTPGFQFVFSHRLMEIVRRIPLVGRLLRRIIWWASCLIFGSELAIAAEIGGGFYIPHPYGIVVGVSKIGRNVRILQNVTIGKRGDDDAHDPVLEDGAALSAGAVVLGAVVIGRDAVVGANSVVLQSVPDGSTAVGIPARILPAHSEPA